MNNDLAEWDLIDLDPGQLASEFRRILKPTGNVFIFMSYNLVGRYHESFDPLFGTFQMMVWHKTNPIPNFFKAGFLNSCELLAACWDKGHTWNFKTQKEMHNFFEGPICMGHERIKGKDGTVLHPTQKPLRILSHIIEIASKPGDLVFDPFMGVASTGAACQTLGRRFLGTEIDPTYHAAACQRLGIKVQPEPKGKRELSKSLKTWVAAVPILTS